jgi:hypothetical protein
MPDFKLSSRRTLKKAKSVNILVGFGPIKQNMVQSSEYDLFSPFEVFARNPNLCHPVEREKRSYKI